MQATPPGTAQQLLALATASSAASAGLAMVIGRNPATVARPAIANIRAIRRIEPPRFFGRSKCAQNAASRLLATPAVCTFDRGLLAALDNLSAHKAPEVRDWLAHPKRERWHLHFIPTSSSWLNLVERRFKELTDRRLRHGAFTSVAELVDAIETWAEHWNDNPRPFIWHVPAHDIIDKVQRGRAALTRTKIRDGPLAM